MTGRMARNKGARGENELAAMLTDHLGFIVKRKLGQARDGADDIEIGKYRIEVKRRETLAIMQWVRQIEACTPADQVPVVAFRQNGQEWRVIIRMKDFLPLCNPNITSDAKVGIHQLAGAARAAYQTALVNSPSAEVSERIRFLLREIRDIEENILGLA